MTPYYHQSKNNHAVTVMNGITYKILIGVDLRLEIAILVVTIIEFT